VTCWNRMKGEARKMTNGLPARACNAAQKRKTEPDHGG
jgi:hypothetical protein